MFKIGDEVFDNERGYGEGVVTSIGQDGWINVFFENGTTQSYTPQGMWSSIDKITLFKKEENMKTYTLQQFKKFATEIEAHESGEQIEVKDGYKWVELNYPIFDLGLDYRVKPKLSREEITANWVKENDLKIGDKVKVLKGFEDGLGIVKGNSDDCIGKEFIVHVICTLGIRLDSNVSGWMFPVECLEKVKEEYIPFTLEDKDLFIGKVIKNKEFNEFFIVTYANKEKAGFDGSYYEYEELLDDYEFEDGTPFGKLKA